uniref:Uncharacterized protein n=1 Tax=Acanthochromis polyacanthus TaxID=80966 RepID=A0A3Q1H1J6_9TELE
MQEVIILERVKTSSRWVKTSSRSRWVKTSSRWVKTSSRWVKTSSRWVKTLTSQSCNRRLLFCRSSEKILVSIFFNLLRYSGMFVETSKSRSGSEARNEGVQLFPRDAPTARLYGGEKSERDLKPNHSLKQTLRRLLINNH